ncbi:MAG: flagellar assembly protein FliW [Oscillospiraceae bacterium]|jgi:flagellar assembly factor FliW|nr:flagellar assembly protein FliW [Oscillospiraceae bacterium]
MLVNTAVLGEVEVSPENVFHMPHGLYGFEEATDYALIKKWEDDVALMWLQNTGADAPCFVVFDPFEIIEGYEPELEASDLRFFGAGDISELDFYVIAVVPEDIAGITVNLKSPVAVHKKDRRARQVILANRDYPIRFPLFVREEA